MSTRVVRTATESRKSVAAWQAGHEGRALA